MSELERRGQFSIGEVLAQLRPEFPDISPSKIRFLEAEGLIELGLPSVLGGRRRAAPRDLDHAAGLVPAAAGDQGTPRA